MTTTNESKTGINEDSTVSAATSCQRILNIECGVRRSLDIGIVYEDGTKKEIVINKGDKLEVVYINENSLQNTRGIVTAILRGPKTLNRATGKLNHVYSIKLDCSDKYSSNTVIIYCELIRDINILTKDVEIDVDVEYLEDNYFNKQQVDYLISWQDIDGTEIE